MMKQKKPQNVMGNMNAVENEQILDSDFAYVERKGDIHDAKLQTKPTTFAKDALKRFAKNKSSVVGAVIIGILLIGSFASFFSPYDIDAPHANETFIEPKLFNAGTGFWDDFA